jgi:hypothetical protein
MIAAPLFSAVVLETLRRQRWPAFVALLVQGVETRLSLCLHGLQTIIASPLILGVITRGQNRLVELLLMRMQHGSLGI